MLVLLSMRIATPDVWSSGHPDPFAAAGRSVLPAVPVVLVLGRWARQRPWLEVLVVGGGFLLQAVWITLFVDGGFLI